MALEFWKDKSGPLPNWAWGGLVLGGAVAFSSWQRNKSEGKEKEATSMHGVEVMPDSIQPTYVFQDYDYTNVTVPGAPPGGGRPPTAPGPITIEPPPKPAPTTPPRPTTPVKPAPKAPVGKLVTVAKWTKKNPPWNSTVWGITNRLLGPKAQWQAVWNAPQNMGLKAKRKDPTKIQPGDKIWVPGAK